MHALHFELKIEKDCHHLELGTQKHHYYHRGRHKI